MVASGDAKSGAGEDPTPQFADPRMAGWAGQGPGLTWPSAADKDRHPAEIDENLSVARQSGRAGSRVPHLVAGSIIREPSLHRLFGRKHLRIGFAEVVASLALS